MAIEFDPFEPSVIEQALAWVARLRSDQVSETDEQEFALWLSQDPSHRAAFDEAMVLWESMSFAASTLDDQKPSAYLSTIEKNEPASNESYAGDKIDKVSQQNKTTKSSSLFRWGSIAASILLITAAVMLWMNNNQNGNPIKAQLYATMKGQQQQFILSDGSTIELNTDTRITVSFTEEARHLHLLAGEAYFSVAKDASRPFTVKVNNAAVTAIGTAFNINHQPDFMTVAVTEGTVAVDPDSDTGSAGNDKDTNEQVTAGEQISVDNSGNLIKSTANLEQATAWRNQTVVFRNISLADALEELNRYLKEPIDSSDPSLKALRISGTFSVREPEATLEAIIASFELQTSQLTDSSSIRLFR